MVEQMAKELVVIIGSEHHPRLKARIGSKILAANNASLAHPLNKYHLAVVRRKPNLGENAVRKKHKIHLTARNGYIEK